MKVIIAVLICGLSVQGNENNLREHCDSLIVQELL